MLVGTDCFVRGMVYGPKKGREDGWSGDIVYYDTFGASAGLHYGPKEGREDGWSEQQMIFYDAFGASKGLHYGGKPPKDDLGIQS